LVAAGYDCFSGFMPEQGVRRVSLLRFVATSSVHLILSSGKKQ
jgi:hypothetical protein